MYIKNHLLELLLIIFFFGAGMLFLNGEYTATKKLIDAISSQVLKEDYLYQQHNTLTTDNVSDEELCALIMGYRDYPMIIDGVTMNPEEEKPEDYLMLVKSGYYRKSYRRDANNNITQIIYTYNGSL